MHHVLARGIAVPVPRPLGQVDDLDRSVGVLALGEEVVLDPVGQSRDPDAEQPDRRRRCRLSSSSRRATRAITRGSSVGPASVASACAW